MPGERLQGIVLLALHAIVAVLFVSVALAPERWSTADVSFLLFQFWVFELVGAMSSMAAGKAWHVSRPGAPLRWAVIVMFALLLVIASLAIGVQRHQAAVLLALLGTIGTRLVDWSLALRASPVQGTRMALAGAIAFTLWMVLGAACLLLAERAPPGAAQQISRFPPDAVIALLIACYYLILGLALFRLQRAHDRGSLNRLELH